MTPDETLPTRLRASCTPFEPTTNKLRHEAADALDSKDARIKELESLLAAPTPAGPSREWLEKMAALEAATGSLSVGGLAADCGPKPPMLPDEIIELAKKYRAAESACLRTGKSRYAIAAGNLGGELDEALRIYDRETAGAAKGEGE